LFGLTLVGGGIGLRILWIGCFSFLFPVIGPKLTGDGGLGNGIWYGRLPRKGRRKAKIGVPYSPDPARLNIVGLPGAREIR
jgi:hypothetical protein